MTTQWFVWHSGGIIGPLSFSQLQAAALNGQLRPEFGVSNDRNNWIKASQVNGLWPPAAGTPAVSTPSPTTSGQDEFFADVLAAPSPAKRPPRREKSPGVNVALAALACGAVLALGALVIGLANRSALHEGPLSDADAAPADHRSNQNVAPKTRSENAASAAPGGSVRVGAERQPHQSADSKADVSAFGRRDYRADAEFRGAIARARKLLADGQLDAAANAVGDAQKLRPGDREADDLLGEIKQKSAADKAQYDGLLTEAEQAAAKEQWSDAEASVKSATARFPALAKDDPRRGKIMDAVVFGSALSQARKSYAAGDFGAAMIAADDALAARPGDQDTTQLRSRISRDFSRKLETDGRAALDAGDFEKGVGLLRHAVSLVPGDANLQAVLDLATVKQHKSSAEGEIAADRILAAGDEILSAREIVARRASGDVGQLRKSIDGLAAVIHGKLLEQAETLTSKRQYQDARENVGLALRLSPSDARSSELLTRIKKLEDDPKTANITGRWEVPNQIVCEFTDTGTDLIAFKAVQLPKHLQECVGHWKRDGQNLTGRFTVVFTAQPGTSTVGTVKATIVDGNSLKVFWQDMTRPTKNDDGIWTWEGRGEGLWTKVLTPSLPQPNSGSDADWMASAADRAARGVVRVEIRRGNNPISWGTGFVIASREGKHLILTNRHVVGEATTNHYTEIHIVGAAKFETSARLAALPNDSQIDLAILLVDPSAELQVFGPIATFESVKPTDPVLAIGNPGLAGVVALTNSVTNGIISGKREERYLQTNAAINHGNSGGPLVGKHGVVGVNTLTFQDIAEGINFAIRADLVLRSSEWSYEMDIDDLMHRIPHSDGESGPSATAEPSRPVSQPTPRPNADDGAAASKGMPADPAADGPAVAPAATERTKTETNEVAGLAMKQLFGRIRAAITTGGVVESEVVGSQTGDTFKDLTATDGTIVGFTLSTAKFGRSFQYSAISLIQPLYLTSKGLVEGQRHGRVESKDVVVRAKPGYAIGAIKVTGNGRIVSIQFTFMKIDGDKLNPKDAYLSEIYGDKDLDTNSTATVSGNGKLLVGLTGYWVKELRGIGVVYAP